MKRGGASLCSWLLSEELISDSLSEVSNYSNSKIGDPIPYVPSLVEGSLAFRSVSVADVNENRRY